MSAVAVRRATAPEDLAAAWGIRVEVFLREQRIAEAIERDGLDDVAAHFVAWDGARAVGTARVVLLDAARRPLAAPADGAASAPGAASAKIGRMAVLAARRRAGVGGVLLAAVLAWLRELGVPRADLSAQAYVVPFYERAGFRAEGEAYEEAGIPHRWMSLSLAGGARA